EDEPGEPKPRECPTRSPTSRALKLGTLGFERRKCLICLAPQVGLEPTTLRLTATQVHQNTAGYTFTKSPHTARYIANGSQFSQRPARPIAEADFISVAIHSSIHYKKFQGASPQKSPQWSPHVAGVLCFENWQIRSGTCDTNLPRRQVTP